jgi:hypothetical protein
LRFKRRVLHFAIQIFSCAIARPHNGLISAPHNDGALLSQTDLNPAHSLLIHIGLSARRMLQVRCK